MAQLFPSAAKLYKFLRAVPRTLDATAIHNLLLVLLQSMREVLALAENWPIATLLTELLEHGHWPPAIRAEVRKSLTNLNSSSIRLTSSAISAVIAQLILKVKSHILKEERKARIPVSVNWLERAKAVFKNSSLCWRLISVLYEHGRVEERTVIEQMWPGKSKDQLERAYQITLDRLPEARAENNHREVKTLENLLRSLQDQLDELDEPSQVLDSKARNRLRRLQKTLNDTLVEIGLGRVERSHKRSERKSYLQLILE